MLVQGAMCGGMRETAINGERGWMMAREVGKVGGQVWLGKRLG